MAVGKICSVANSGPKEPLPADIQRDEKRRSLWIAIADVLFCQFICSPLVISHWAYVWDLADATGKDEYSAAICGLGGFTVLIVACLGQPWLKQVAVTKHGNAIPVVANFYMFALSMASILAWRGVWTAMDLHFGLNLRSCCYTLTLGLVALLPLAAIKTAAASPPFATANDDAIRLGGEIYDFPTRFNAKDALSLAGDAFVSVVLVTVGVVGLWRGLWLPQDLYLTFDDDPSGIKSNALSCVAGWLSTLILLSMQIPVDLLCGKLERCVGWWARFGFESTWSFLQTCATVLLWRGIWNFSLNHLDLLFPGVPLFHAKLTMACFTLLLLLMFSVCSNSAAKGCVHDGHGVGNFISYFSAFSDVITAAEGPRNPAPPL